MAKIKYLFIFILFLFTLTKPIDLKTTDIEGQITDQTTEAPIQEA